MIEFNKNYFVASAIENEKSLMQYIFDSQYNYIVMLNKEPLLWDNGCPVVFGSTEDVYDYVYGYGVESYLITEWDFISTYCIDELTKAVAKAVEAYGWYDGVCHIVEIGLNNIVDIDGMTDIVTAFVDSKHNLCFLVSDANDESQDYFHLCDFSSEAALEIIKIILDNEIIKNFLDNFARMAR